MKRAILKVVVCFSLLILSAVLVNAQLGVVTKPRVMLGANFIYAMPQGDFKEAYTAGAGGEVYGGVGWGSTYLLGTVGITGYKAASGNSAGTLTAVPVKVGLKKYFLLKKVFLNGDVGVSTLKVSSTSSSAFTAGFGAGVKLLGLEAALYYNAFKNKDSNGYYNSLNAKIGWSFSL